MDQSPSDASAPMGTGTSFPRSVLLISAAILVLVVVALVVAVALPSQPTRYPAGSPEAAFQDYYAAWEAGDTEAAYGYLSATVTADLTLATYRQMDSDWSYQRAQDRRIVLLSVDVTGDRAVLHIRVDQFVGGGLGVDRYSDERSIRLVREVGNWRIDEALMGIESVAYKY